MITIYTDEQVLDEAFRAECIKSWKKSAASKERIENSLKRHRVYSDQTKLEVIALLKRELKAASVEQMASRAANVSICRKIIDKLAVSYVGGVQRVAQDEQDQEAVDELARYLNLDSKMKQLDRKFELQKNAIFGVLPYKALDQDFRDGETVQYTLKPFSYEPYRYHALADAEDNEVARAIIIEEQCGQTIGEIKGLPSSSDGHGAKGFPLSYDGQVYGQDSSEYIWWTSKYHFTTDGEGKIIKASEDLLNPIGKIPFVMFADNQNGNFWGRGGEDLIDGAILINLLLTDMLNIANVQGWGQLVLTGKNLPKDIQVGPHTAIVLDVQDGDPSPDVDYKNSGAPLEKWMQMVEQYTALILSTNHLSPSTVAAKLDGANPQSGIAMLIEQSESTLDLEDRQKMYQDKEHEIWEIIKRWQEVYEGAFVPKLAAVPTLKNSDVRVKFMRTKPVITEDQKLQNIKLRKELGINSMIELLMIDNPDLTVEEAEEKLAEIMAEKLNNVASMMNKAMSQSKEEDGEEKQDGVPEQIEAEDEADAEEAETEEAKPKE